MKRLFMRRGWWIAAAIILIAAVIIIFLTRAYASRVSKVWEPIEVQSMAIDSFDANDPTKTLFGGLKFRGGLVLTSKNNAFGGISALHIQSDGSHFLATTDQGSWLRGRLLYHNDKVTGIADAEMAPILGNDGKPLTARRWHDAESLTERDGQFYIGIERAHKVLRFDMRRDGLAARGQPLTVPPDFGKLSYNKSLECLAALPGPSPYANDLIAVTERSLDSDGNFRAFLFASDRNSTPIIRFSVKRSEDYDVSDCAILPPNDLLLLERRLSVKHGVAMRIRKIPLGEIREKAVIEGRLLIEADWDYQIDNMEGIAVNQNVRGERIITLVSDDNFLFLQRSLLLQFTLVE